jgi:DNA-binding beta-propeller fold protein YncE
LWYQKREVLLVSNTLITYYISKRHKQLKSSEILDSKYIWLNIFLTSIGTFVLFLISIMVSNSYSAALSSPTDSYANATNYVLLRTWGNIGKEDGQFNRPHDLDFSPSENKLYVIDRDNNRVQVFNKNGTFLFKWGSTGKGDGEFNLAYGIDVDKQGNVWVADRNNSRIQKFDARGNFLLKFGSQGSGPGQFDNPRHIAVDEALKYVYVADSLNHRIQKFDTNGNFIKSFGREGNKSGEFGNPGTIVIDSGGNLYINERTNERIQKFDTEGNPILMWGSKGSGSNQFCHIEHLGIDKFNNIYVTDPQSDPGCSHKPAVKKFDSNGNFITQWEIAGEGNDLDPEHLAIDSDERVYVSERSGGQIQVYVPIEE